MFAFLIEEPTGLQATEGATLLRLLSQRGADSTEKRKAIQNLVLRHWGTDQTALQSKHRLEPEPWLGSPDPRVGLQANWCRACQNEL